jgi:hypothetical protein
MTWGGKARWMLTLAWRWWWLLVWWCGSGYMTRAMEPLFIGCTRPCLSVGGKSWIPDIQIIKGVFFKRHPEVGRRARAFRGPARGGVAARARARARAQLWRSDMIFTWKMFLSREKKRWVYIYFANKKRFRYTWMPGASRRKYVIAWESGMSVTRASLIGPSNYLGPLFSNYHH